MELNNIWAKTEPFQSVLTHGVVTGIVAQTLVEKVLSAGNVARLQALLGLSRKETVDFVGYLASVHDIGKIEPLFQQQDKAALSLLRENGMAIDAPKLQGIRHEQSSMAILKRIWGSEGADRISRNLFAKITKAHHQGKSGKGKKEFLQEWIELQNQFELQMRSVFLEGAACPIPTVQKEEGALSALLLGIVILSDWIASGSQFSKAEHWAQEESFHTRVKEESESFFRLGGFVPESVQWGDSFCGVWPNIPEDGMRTLQRETERYFQETEERASLLLLEAPMGEGKTEAGMYAALQMAKQWGKEGFYVALPTSATANQMVGRMRALLKLHQTEDSVRLLHAMAWLVDSQPGESTSPDERDTIVRWLAPVRRGLLSPYAVGTVDQAMLAATQVKYGVLRLLGLSNKVLVIDEVHSYDVYMSEIVVRLLEWCRALEVPVVMLSATLPPNMKQKLFEPYAKSVETGAYPAIATVSESGRVVTRVIPPSGRKLTVQTAIKPFLHQPQQIAELAVERVRDGGCLCVLLNTVKQAQETYSAIKRIYNGKLILFHARFPAERRDEIEKECLELFGKDKSKRPEQAILVATQVVEQSLDVDFDTMITAIAPIDLLLQRMGRIFRHENSPRPAHLQSPSQWILIPKEDGSFGADEMIYPPCLLRQSAFLLAQRSEISIPDDLAQLVADGYDSEKAPVEERDRWLEQWIEDSVKASSSEPYLLSHPEKEFSPLGGKIEFDDEQRDSFLSVQTRLGEPTVRIALLEEAMFAKLEKVSEYRLDNGKKQRYNKCINKAEAQEVLKQSVSVTKRSLLGLGEDSRVIHGGGLLANVEIYPAENGVFTAEGGGVIRFDSELGVLIEKEGEN